MRPIQRHVDLVCTGARSSAGTGRPQDEVLHASIDPEMPPVHFRATPTLRIVDGEALP